MSCSESSAQAVDAEIGDVNLEDFQRWLRSTHSIDVSTYHDLHRWSVDDIEQFWRVLAEYFDIAHTGSLEPTLAESAMPGARWFPHVELNYVEQVMRHLDQSGVAIIGVSETGEQRHVSWPELARQVGALATTLRAAGIGEGDVVVGYLPNVPESIVAFLAAAALGATWACCGQDFSGEAAEARLGQLTPSALVTADGYRFGGRTVDKRDDVRTLARSLSNVRLTVIVPRIGLSMDGVIDASTGMSWSNATEGEHPIRPVRVPFDHPLWVLFSSGTTGRPKGIVHGHGGVLLEHLKQMWLHWDLTDRDVFFWFTSPSWMLWNMQPAALLVGATVVCYDGSPDHQSPATLWDIASRNGVTLFGTSPGYLQLSEKSGVAPNRDQLPNLRLIGATGSVVPSSAYRWVEARFGVDMPLQSIAGGTDIVSGFAGPVPTLPVREGRLTAALLGVALECWDDAGQPVTGRIGELVVTAPLPSMPIGFWDDPGGERYRATYFDRWPGVWRHGDWITIDGDGSVLFHGRSDATLNRNGVRMGSADIYAVVEQMPEVLEALVVGVELPEGGYWMPLFVVLRPGAVLDDELRSRIVNAIRREASPRHVPDVILQASGLPHTRTGKKLEVPVKRILRGAAVDDVLDVRSLDDASLLDQFVRLSKTLIPQQ
ncbi:acetoacetate--CoA ligase [Rhodococcus sp. BP-149]|uniref:acetoacetate--CoA ligase n=1 Tax=unclassified Rhodococcus (in: high G+C Gram-positive bacteria) TaxID=192944 RepID=UPI001C9ADAA1|nr:MULTISPECIES: acetoacetate--CoA ligase [unclassified Rhodococcus (in: high G+C Gram-positive bacteria)]MBY6687754.1 acetoacetate--CoA ligase [Rhodococcus sp. BP-288]MBY6696019.1 acetoacetate--CoA ligase [Rhodococcus sp. BP-188]MBY6700616.1 acetoacetate--CoA ligase [Rhodococcus sp. BP-285]MBY6705013.1 acetoacetate--CoA ligase [Rhodococcus sp. BP-283]MBY6708573.1 acetoacetate--CoA ligase [Rhodococcus sp. BP-241]